MSRKAWLYNEDPDLPWWVHWILAVIEGSQR